MGAGQGKTIVILLVAAYLATEDTNVRIVVLNEVLKEQMLDDLNKVLQGNKFISIVEIANLQAVQPKSYIYLLDECDAMLKEHLLVFKQTANKQIGVFGLPAVYLSTQHSIWFSATLNRNDRKLLNEIFDVEEKDITQLESQAKISVGRDIENFVPQEVVARDQQTLIQKVKEVIEENIKTTPMIIF